jgi:hypothetical protein
MPGSQWKMERVELFVLNEAVKDIFDGTADL